MSAPQATSPPTLTPEMKELALMVAVQTRIKRAASWFYWIAGLSLVNSIIVAAGGRVHFIIGMGVTEVVDAMASHGGGLGLAVGMVINVMVAGVCAAFGWLGARHHAWAVRVGMVLYTLDGLLLVLFQDWFSVAFHAYALYRIYPALKAIRLADEMVAKMGPPPAVISSSSPMG